MKTNIITSDRVLIEEEIQDIKSRCSLDVDVEEFKRFLRQQEIRVVYSLGSEN